nr:putative clathrin assembly protein At4g25940 [Ipomoea trifida]
MDSFRKAYGALKDSTQVGLAKVNSEFKVAIKALIVVHRTLREGDPTFKEELLNFAQRGHIFSLSNFKDDSGPGEERLECFRTLRYDIEAERMSKATSNAHGEGKSHAKTRYLSGEGLLDHLPALQQLLYRLIGCRVLKESFKIYCAINDGIINLVDLFFEMSKHDAVKALNIYKCAGQQASNLADFYQFCKGLDLARTFQFPSLRQPPPSFLATMEEYIREAPQFGSVSSMENHSTINLFDEIEKSSGWELALVNAPRLGTRFKKADACLEAFYNVEARLTPRGRNIQYFCYFKGNENLKLPFGKKIILVMISSALGTWVFSVAGALLAIPVGIKRKSLAPLVFFGTTGTMLDIIMGISACEREHAERQKLLEAQNSAAAADALPNIGAES